MLCDRRSHATLRYDGFGSQATQSSHAEPRNPDEQQRPGGGLGNRGQRGREGVLVKIGPAPGRRRVIGVVRVVQVIIVPFAQAQRQLEVGPVQRNRDDDVLNWCLESSLPPKAQIALLLGKVPAGQGPAWKPTPK